MRTFLRMFNFLLMWSFCLAAGVHAEGDASPVKKGGFQDPVTGMEFVFVKGGCYRMGDTAGSGEPREKPVHEVCVSDFYLGRTEVTQGQWEKMMEVNPSRSRECGPDCPVDSVTWTAAKEFIDRLNGKSGQKYRLPTEAEWEYAARSGGKDELWSGTSDPERLGDFAWYFDNRGDSTKPVGLKKPNGLGIHDMTGNVAEWCQDWFSETYYGVSPRDNPAGPDSGSARVLRGGGPYFSHDVRVARRMSDSPGTTDSDYGFRVLRPSP